MCPEIIDGSHDASDLPSIWTAPFMGKKVTQPRPVPTQALRKWLKDKAWIDGIVSAAIDGERRRRPWC